jgi:lipopolysaccharide export system protein LptA
MSASALAFPSDRSQPISLVADKATYNDKTGITTYTGNVVIEQGTMKLQADSIVAQLNSNVKFKPLLPMVDHPNFSNRLVLKKGLHVVKRRKLFIMQIQALLL